VLRFSAPAIALPLNAALKRDLNVDMAPAQRTLTAKKATGFSRSRLPLLLQVLLDLSAHRAD
jgi:hypothetical protein